MKIIIDIEKEYEIVVRNSIEDDYLGITDEMIRNNLVNLIQETITKESIVITKDGSIPYTTDRQIKLIGINEVVISFATYDENENNDAGRQVVIVERGSQVNYYYSVNELHSFIPLALTNNNTFLATVVDIEHQSLQITSDVFGVLMISYEQLPENIASGDKIEVVLGEISESSKGIFAQSVVIKE